MELLRRARPREEAATPGPWAWRRADTRLAQGIQHHRHVATVLAGSRLDRGVLGHLLRDLLEDLAPDLGVSHLAAPEHDRELDLRALAQEALDVLHLGFEVVPVDLGPELHLLDDDVRRPLARFLASLILFVLPLAEVHDPANRWISVRRNLDEVESLFACHRQRLGKWLHPVLGAVTTDEQYLAGANAIVDAGVVSGQSGFSSCRRSRRETAAGLVKPAAGTARSRDSERTRARCGVTMTNASAWRRPDGWGLAGPASNQFPGRIPA